MSGQRVRRFRIFVRYRNDEFFDAWEVEAPSIAALIGTGVIRERIGDQPYDELMITELW